MSYLIIDETVIESLNGIIEGLDQVMEAIKQTYGLHTIDKVRENMHKAQTCAMDLYKYEGYHQAFMLEKFLQERGIEYDSTSTVS